MTSASFGDWTNGAGARTEVIGSEPRCFPLPRKYWNKRWDVNRPLLLLSTVLDQMAGAPHFSRPNKMFRLSIALRNSLVVVLIFCLVTVPYSSGYFPAQLLKSDRFRSRPPTTLIDSRCDALSNPPDTVVVVKTGANGIYDKVPTQILTALYCYDDLLFFSDLGQQLGPYSIHDALANVTGSVKMNNPQFDYYHMLQQYHKDGRNIGALRQKTGDAAWNLDKYKFIHMLEKSWKLRPNRKWYVYIEADTYLVRSNLRLWLDRLDPTEPLYLGSPTYVNGEAFSHGGSGFVLSGVSLSQFANGDESVAARYDEMMKRERFGDYVLMRALRDKGVDFRPAWPMLQGEKPFTIPFGPSLDNGVRHWCQPIVTMHHITPDEASQIWAFEQQRQNVTEPLLLKDLYLGMVAPEVHAERDDWFNLSDDLFYRAPGVSGDRQKSEQEMTPVEKQAHMSFEHCSRACEEQDRCSQFAYSEQSCGFSYSYRLGGKYPPDPDGKRYKSGWALAKIARDQASYPCDTPAWS